MAKKKPKPRSPFLAAGTIASMSNWDEDYLNEEVRAFIEFEPGQRGEFHFGYVRGGIDYRDALRTGARRRIPLGQEDGWTRPRAGAGPSWMATGLRDDLLPPARSGRNGSRENSPWPKKRS